MRRFFLFLLAVWPAVALGQGEPDLSDVMRARNYGMGGAYRAIALGGEAIIGSPAALALRRRYDFELSGAWDSQTKFGYGSAAVIDSQTTDVAAGATYHFVSLGRGDQQRSVNLAALALAAGLSDNVYFGFGLKYIVESGAISSNAVTIDLGLLVRLSDSILASVTGMNLVDVANRDLPRHFGLGLAYVAGPLTVAADARADFNGPSVRFAYHGGIEYVVGGSIPVRAGYERDNIIGADYVSGGLGFAGRGGGIDVAYRHEIGGREGRLFALTLHL
jgi:hypothetical protein